MPAMNRPLPPALLRVITAFLAGVACLVVSGCSPLTRLLGETSESVGGVPPEQVPYMRLSRDLQQTEARFAELGFRENPVDSFLLDWRERLFFNATPDQLEGTIARSYSSETWHRGNFTLLVRGDEVLLVTWRLQPFMLY